MNMVIPDTGKTYLLNNAVNPLASDGENWVVELYQNDYTPVDGSVKASFTAATFTGYAAVDLVAADWGAASITSAIAYATYPTPPDYLCTGGATQTVYGWFMYGSTTNTLIAAQRFDTPRVMSSGAEEKLDPFRIAAKTFA